MSKDGYVVTLMLGSERLQVGDAGVQVLLLLLGGDAGEDVAHDPVDHVLLNQRREQDM